jgi:hypothetical protein
MFLVDHFRSLQVSLLVGRTSLFESGDSSTPPPARLPRQESFAGKLSKLLPHFRSVVVYIGFNRKIVIELIQYLNSDLVISSHQSGDPK